MPVKGRKEGGGGRVSARSSETRGLGWNRAHTERPRPARMAARKHSATARKHARAALHSASPAAHPATLFRGRAAHRAAPHAQHNSTCPHSRSSSERGSRKTGGIVTRVRSWPGIRLLTCGAGAKQRRGERAVSAARRRRDEQLSSLRCDDYVTSGRRLACAFAPRTMCPMTLGWSAGGNRRARQRRRKACARARGGATADEVGEWKARSCSRSESRASESRPRSRR